ncbi:hypothetical protein QQS21_006671 [Conoideocrella luteorostrata]|uniref:Uncharacterized protein n=1 Tax=Conoideocrella luteorostrata TaxID=1105319 RepID=A0AAJ0CPX8_9HYPO|nr:hypothetical protein QQS21_006671 [Conoideocrella luteorostrata]
MDTWRPYPYPLQKSPMEGTTAQHEEEWLHAASTDPTFVHPLGHKSITEALKLELLQRTFWPSLAQWVEARQEVLQPGGEILGGWSRADMYGMMDWYRLCFNMTSRYEDAVAAHRDGIWRTVILTSPWWDWPEFAYLYVKTVRDAHGAPQRDANGRVQRETRDPYDDKLEDEFMDLWEKVANTRPLRKHANGKVMLPVDRKQLQSTVSAPAPVSVPTPVPGSVSATTNTGSAIASRMAGHVPNVPSRTATPQAAR